MKFAWMKFRCVPYDKTLRKKNNRQKITIQENTTTIEQRNNLGFQLMCVISLWMQKVRNDTHGDNVPPGREQTTHGGFKLKNNTCQILRKLNEILRSECQAQDY